MARALGASYQIRELRQKLLPKPEATVKLEATTGNDTAEERRQATAGAPPAGACKDGSSDSDSSVVFSDVEASPYSGGAAFEPPALAGLGAPFLDTSVAPTGCSSPPVFVETKWQQHGPTQYPFPFDSYKACAGYGFTEEWLASSDLIGSDGGAAGFFSEDHASTLNFNWCPSGIQGWE